MRISVSMPNDHIYDYDLEGEQRFVETLRKEVEHMMELPDDHSYNGLAGAVASELEAHARNWAPPCSPMQRILWAVENLERMVDGVESEVKRGKHRLQVHVRLPKPKDDLSKSAVEEFLAETEALMRATPLMAYSTSSEEMPREAAFLAFFPLLSFLAWLL